MVLMFNKCLTNVKHLHLVLVYKILQKLYKVSFKAAVKAYLIIIYLRFWPITLIALDTKHHF